ncbi:hypothetical protein N6H05_01860 [Sphingobium sp. WTD-1]|uniref:hypothetical protein n=1 Tax=Sphingobium sp. WTD-1 TaxID=2979467 RepID=UPI0024DE2E35|nr:hypothetical protein [Sphingobium sp. WTD-1]WIA55467.1 hypothetical protein N6H05_20930 [Sphingobium sp. WTD-1]WIA56596.1 hypothetical protein N6H05_01860 [Sphingobium sp. WTD-1]
MKASSPRKRGNRAWQKVVVAPGEDMTMVADKLRECGQRGGDGEPIEAHALFDAQSRLRRIHARYANGWRATLVVRVDGSYSLSQAIKIVSQARSMPA